ncbi:MAG TPA: GTP-dependent dephospho-CoA kinase family protein [Candidatus Thermoplasmatota archaeon]|nr:GTP-dependent dephospho-CoA kinase family protein [Candidatus Thermoplasmatota archaeon]
MTSYHLPHALRPVLAQPFGPVHDTGEALRKTSGRTIIAVGDVVTQMFLDAGVLPKLMLVDGVTKRGAKVEGALQNLPEFGVKRVEVKNPAAAITHQLLSVMDTAIRGKGSTLITVIGEEDLAALPAMILAPEGAAVCYGQPNEGVVVVIVTPVVRKRAKDILEKMDVK